MTKHLFFFALGWLMPTTGQSQSFRMRADVGPVSQSGYQRILLPPDVVGQLNANLTDVRLYDNDQHEVPYLLTRQRPGEVARLVDFDLVNRVIEPKRATTLVLRNRHPGKLRSMTLEVRNADSEKKARLSGSTDARTWYAVREGIWLRPVPVANQTTTTLRVDIPISDYPYYRLVIADSLSEPLNILRVSHDSTTVRPGQYTPIDKLSFVQRDSSDRKTYIQIFRSSPARFDKLKLSFSIKARFFRSAAVGQFRVHKPRRGRPERYFESIQNFAVSSADSNTVDLPDGLNTRELWVVIDNADNQPLPVKSVSGYQIRSFLIANLTAGTAYQLRFSGADVAAPSYDLTHFQRSIPAKVGFVPVTNIMSVDAAQGSLGLSFPKWAVWPALLLVLGLLGYFSVKMLRETGKA